MAAASTPGHSGENQRTAPANAASPIAELPDAGRIDVAAQADAAAKWIRQRWPERPRIGIVLGTGSGDIAESIRREHSFAYSEIPYFPHSTAIGHKGQWLCGEFAGQAVVAMQGRFHLYEGYHVDQSTIGIHTMQRLGIERVLITNAAGGINPQFRLGEIMAINSHIDFMFRATPALCGATSRMGMGTDEHLPSHCLAIGDANGATPDDRHAPIEFAGARRPRTRSDTAYCPQLIAAAQNSARRHGFPLHQGVYVSMLGPNYETRAEYRWLRRIGGDTVGMSTVPEAMVAASYGLRVLACSVVTNVASPDALQPTSGHEVVAAAQRASHHLLQLFADVCRAEG